MERSVPVVLSDDDHARLQVFLHRGKATARSLTRARILLKASEGWSDAELVGACDVCANTVTNVCTRFIKRGLDAVLYDQRQARRRQARRRQARRRQALSNAQAAHLIAIACSPVPDGHDHWTLRMLADKAIVLGYVERLSPETVRQLLKKPC